MTLLVIIFIMVLLFQTALLVYVLERSHSERSVYQAQIKDLTDKIYFIRSTNDFITNKVVDETKTQTPPSEEEQGVPLEMADQKDVEEALRHG
jgi:hypothetical protein